MLVGPAFVDHDLVFPRPDGTPTHPDAFSQTFDPAVARLGLPDYRHNLVVDKGSEYFEYCE